MRNQITHYDNILLYHTTSHMIKAGYYFRSHMTGSTSNQFTNEISMLLYYVKYFIIQILGNITHWIHVLPLILQTYGNTSVSNW